MHEASSQPNMDDLTRLKKVEERLRDILDHTNDLVQVLAPDTTFLYTNRKWRETLGYSEEEVKTLTLADVLHPDFAACCLDRFERLQSGATMTSIEFRFITRRGHAVDLAGDCGSLIREGSVVATRGIFKDITEQKAAESDRQQIERRYLDLFEHAPDICLTITRDTTIRSINQRGARDLGYQPEELIGQSGTKLLHPDDADKVYTEAMRVFDGELDEFEHEYRKLRSDGSVIWVQDRMRLVPTPEGRPPELLCVCRDVTESRRLKADLEHQATHDPLTGLINRSEFENRLSRVLYRVQSMNEQHAVCYLDLDQFKIVNDTCGHMAGDELLQHVSKIMGNRIRHRDTLARLGGDEFVILMEHCDIEHAQRVCEDILTSISEFTFRWKGEGFSIGASIGVVNIDRHMSGIDKIIGHADAACYAAKQAGRNQVQVGKSF